MTLENPNWRYDKGDSFAGRTVLSRKSPGVTADGNIYEVFYACCERTGTLLQQSLRRLEMKHPKELVLCNLCCATKANKAAHAPEVERNVGPRKHRQVRRVCWTDDLQETWERRVFPRGVEKRNQLVRLEG